ncbi:MAG: hypothetical protein DI635_04105 [Pseudoxanthomonas suwonensis]|nr:MAG: hypothetical protein DI635_04105 [Pseudoxanthomonas suwonensis]
MPAILAALGAFLLNLARQYLPGIVGRLMLAIGIGFVAHEVAVPSLLGLIQSQLSGLPTVILAYFGALGLDVCVTIILSAIAGRAAQKVLLTKLAK